MSQEEERRRVKGELDKFDLGMQVCQKYNVNKIPNTLE